MDSISNRPTGTVTFLFTDVEASTRKWEEHEAEMREAMVVHDRVVRAAIESRGGAVFTTAGDSFCAAFESPSDALDAAVNAQVDLGEQAWGDLDPFRVRMALHSGNADERDGDYFGPPLNRCARLLSTGHGGQILVSLTTEQLLTDSLSADTSLIDLGEHRLKDLDRKEHVFQVVHPRLTRDFPALRSGGSIADAADDVATARQAHTRQEWDPAYEAYRRASAVLDLDAEDIERYAEAAWWMGKSDEGIALREKAYGAFITEGKDEQAALQALALAEAFGHRLASAVASGWLGRAERLFEGREDAPGYGYLLRLQSVWAFEGDGDAERGLALAEQVHALGLTHGDRNLQALGLQDKGRFLVSLGQIDEGMRLMDEAMVSAVGGELDAVTTGRSYCNMLSACDNVADYQRAGEWVDAAAAWCEGHSDSGYPGVCRIFSAEIKWLRGAWDDAAQEVQRAVEELTGFTDVIGVAWYQLGEIQLRAGDLDGAEEMFRTAHEHGKMPIPGMARLYLLRGDAEGAVELLDEALEPGRLGPPARARLLPTWIDAQIALGRLEEAAAAVSELEETCKLTGSAAIDAATGRAKGSLALAQGRPEDAVPHLESSIRSWSKMQMPYEAADARVLLAEAKGGLGSKAAARLEIDAARSAFSRLGATGDVERVDALLAG
jgi:class 3 adenylate cyclase